MRRIGVVEAVPGQAEGEPWAEKWERTCGRHRLHLGAGGKSRRHAGHEVAGRALKRLRVKATKRRRLSEAKTSSIGPR